LDAYYSRPDPSLVFETASSGVHYFGRIRMRRALIALVAVLSLSLGAAVAQAQQTRTAWGEGGMQPSATPTVAVAGTVVSVNASANSFVANAALVSEGCSGDDQGGGDDQGSGGDQGGGFGGDDCMGGFESDWGGGFGGGEGAALTQVTIMTNSSTTITVNGQTATLASLAAGDRFVATFPVPASTMQTPAPTSTSGGMGNDWDSGGMSSGLTIQQVVMSPALSVSAEAGPQLYAFVGTVAAVDTTAGTVTVNVTSSIPTGLITSPATFTVSADTLILGGNATGGLFGGTLSGVTVGDVVAGGLIGTTGETLTQIEATPLRVLVDFPVVSTATTATMATTKARALSKALALLGPKSHSRRARAHHRRHAHRTHARKHARRA
jgi:hypothetical protein